MLGLPASVRVYLAADACDMRRGFDALAAIVKQSFGDDHLQPPVPGSGRTVRKRHAVSEIKEPRRPKEGGMIVKPI